MPAHPLRIAFLSLHDPQDVRAFSGIAHFAFAALQAHVGQVTALPPPKLPAALGPRIRCAAGYVRDSWRALRPEDFDLAFVVQAPVVGAFLPRRIPVVINSDNTWVAYEDYYPQVYRHAWQRSLRRGVEWRALRRADLLVLASGWAAGSAMRGYGVPPERIEVIPYGANLTHVPPRREPGAWAHAPVVELLLLGVSWERKGGPLALEAVRWLNQHGVPAHLTVCGCAPPAHTPLPPDVTVLPFLDKAVPADAQRLHALLQRSHFLLLPTRAECMGLVFCEASAHGVPSITTCTGGVPAVVEDGVNGRTLPLSATGEDFGRAVAQEWQDREAFVRLSCRARQRYEERLNWEAWARALGAALPRHFPALARREPGLRASA